MQSALESFNGSPRMAPQYETRRASGLVNSTANHAEQNKRRAALGENATKG